MMREQSFLILTPGFPKDKDDTTCIPSIQSFVKCLKREHPTLQIIVVATDYPYTSEPYTWNGVGVIPLNHNNSKRLKRYAQLIKAYTTLKQLKAKNEFAGILSLWCSYTALLGHFFGKRNGIQHYCWLRGQDVRKGNHVARFFSNRSHELISLAPAMNDELEKNYGYRAKKIIPMAVDSETFSDFQPSKKDIDIIGVGSLTQLKQWNVFVDVVAELININPTLKCYLCGDGSERKKLEHLISSKGLSTNIKLTGELPYQQVLELMSQSKILIHPSSYEGYAAVFAEALFAGCHCISFVDPEQQPINHWHIAKSKEEMVKMCKDVLQLPLEEFCSLKQYSMEECVGDILNLYNFWKTSTIPLAIAEKDSLALK